jgi:hypothetical protein
MYCDLSGFTQQVADFGQKGFGADRLFDLVVGSFPQNLLLDGHEIDIIIYAHQQFL